MSIDVIIPTHEKDINTLNICIDYARKNIIDLNKIYVISRNKLTDNAIWIRENIFPFKLEDIIKEIGLHWKTCWYYSQLLKLSIFNINVNLCDYVLILDSDTMILKPISFIDNDGKMLYNISPSDGTDAYNEFVYKCIDIKKQYNGSGIVHHMLFYRPLLLKLIYLIEHKQNMVYWKAILNIMKQPYNSIRYKGCIWNGPGRMSEYELYLSFVYKYYRDNIKIRLLNSIMSYKGWIGLPGYTKGELSRTNLKGNRVQIINPDIEKKFNFKNVPEAISYISDQCNTLGYDMITFQNHQRIGHTEHVKINTKYITELSMIL